MKILHKYFLSFMLFILTFSQVACKKEFLEIEPKGYLIAKNTKDYEQLLNATYLSSIFTASGYMGDEVGVQQKYFDGASLRMQRLFRFEDRVYQPDELPLEMTDESSYIRRLYVFNKVINEVMSSEGGTEQQKQAILAEAKVGRAICNLQFLNDFSMPYNGATATTDLGIPLIKKADVTATEFVRSSIQESYDFVIQDLTEALPDLGALTHRRKLSRAAAEFYLGRVYLYMANYISARTHIDGAFAELGKAKIPLALYDYNTVLGDEGTWLPDYGFGPSGKPLAADNTQIIYNIESSTFQIGSANAFVFTPETGALFDPSDKRLSLYSGTELFGDFVFPKGMMRYPGFSSDIGPSVPDLYLMRAELKARANDLAGAKQDVELLRAERMSENVEVPVAITSSQQNLVRFILDERIREFALTGVRWLDMRRLSVDPLYNNTVNYSHNLYNDAGDVVSTYTLRPARFALKFGERMLAESKGLVENP